MQSEDNMLFLDLVLSFISTMSEGKDRSQRGVRLTIKATGSLESCFMLEVVIQFAFALSNRGKEHWKSSSGLNNKTK